MELNHTLTNKTATIKNRSTEYSTPSWMQKLDIPSIGFHLEASTYNEITKIIFKIVCFTLSTRPSQHNRPKKVPLSQNLSLENNQRRIQDCWNIQDRALCDNSDGYRHITLQPVLSKVFTSILRNRIQDFCYKNKYIESNLQKGFWDDISGCIEHSETLTHIMNHAKEFNYNAT